MDYDERIFQEAENDTELVYEDSYLAEEVTFLILGIIGIITNIFLIYLICYFTKLHTNTNIYLVNWAISNIGAICMVVNSFDIFSTLFDISLEVLDFYYDLEFTLTISVMIFMLLITTDWCISAYLPRVLDKFRENTRIVVACIWIFSALYLISTFATEFWSIYCDFLFLIIFAALLIFVVVLHSIRFVKKCKRSPQYISVNMLLIPTVFLVCWIFCWINLLVLDFYQVPIEIYWYSDIPLFLHPVINLGLVVILDKDFKVCFLQTIRRMSCGLFKISQQNSDENVVHGEA